VCCLGERAMMGRAAIVAFMASALLAGCGTAGAADAPPDAAADVSTAAPPNADAGADVEAAASSGSQPIPPQEVNLGGRVLAAPRIVPITYDGDPYRDQIEAFVTKLGASSFWHDVTAEYGVGPAVSGRPVHLAGPAPATIDDPQVKQWITSMLDGTHADFDPLDGNTMYAIYYPDGTTYTLDGWTGCNQFGASDNVAQMPDGRTVPYIVLPRCPPVPGLDAWGTLSAVSSHEFYEEATDPDKSELATVDTAHMAWSLTPPFSEIGDMCIADLSQYIVPVDVGSPVQRAWSNSAAAAGHNPCVPALDTTPYFVASAVLPDDVPIAFSKFQYSTTTRGVRIPVGQTRTIEVDLWSEAPVPAWRVRAYDLAAAEGKPAELTLSLDDDHGESGDRLQLTITALAAGADGGSRFLLYSDDGRHSGFWFGWVAN
jgi:hypothetical protein